MEGHKAYLVSGVAGNTANDRLSGASRFVNGGLESRGWV